MAYDDIKSPGLLGYSEQISSTPPKTAEPSLLERINRLEKMLYEFSEHTNRRINDLQVAVAKLAEIIGVER